MICQRLIRVGGQPLTNTDVPGDPSVQTEGSGHARTLTGLTGQTWIPGRGCGLRWVPTGHTAGMEHGMDEQAGRVDGLWLEATAGAQASVDAELRDDAYEVFVAEAARCRLVDRMGPTRMLLRCGEVVDGTLAPDPGEAVDDHLALRGPGGRLMLVPSAAIVSATGSRSALRTEGGVSRTVRSWLREAWMAGDPLRVLDCRGRWTGGRLTLVGSDHVELEHDGLVTVVALSAVEAWQRR